MFLFFLFITFLTYCSNADRVVYQNTFLNIRSTIEVDTNSDTSKFLVKGFMWKKEGAIHINGSLFKIDASFDSFLRRNNIHIESVRFVEYDLNHMIIQSLYKHTRIQNPEIQFHPFTTPYEIRVDVNMPLIGRKELSFLPELNLVPHLFREEEER